MKTLLAAILLIGFVGLAVFGFAEMAAANGHNTGAGHRTCLASAVQRIDCPNEFGDFGSAFFHMAAFKFFSTVAPETTLLWFLTVIILAAVRFYLLALDPRLALAPINSFRSPISDRLSPTSRLPSLISWLALKELSPTQR